MCLIYLSSGTLVFGMLIHVLIDAVGVLVRPSEDVRHDTARA
jgi:hypothetical protein